MNKVVCSRWEPTYFAELEIYLDNGDKIVLSYKQTKPLPDEVKSVGGNRYSIIIDNDKIIGFKSLD